MESAGRRGWQHAAQSYLNKFQGPDVRLGQLVLLWCTAMAAVLGVCALFFIVVLWMVG